MREAPTQGRALAEAWFESFRTGDVERSRWLMTRPFTYDVRGERSSCPPRDLWATVALSRALARAFPGWTLVPDETMVREHRVEVTARLEGWHTGLLDLRCVGRGVYPSTGRGLHLPAQRFGWEIVHQRIHRFEVVDGPGLGVDLILEQLDLAPADALPASEIAHERLDPQDAAAEPQENGRHGSPRAETGAEPVRVEEPLASRIDHAILKHRRRRRRQRLWTP